MRHFLLPVLASCLWLAPACGKAEDGGAKGRGVALAVIDFDYIDTSGEERDQHLEHEARLGVLVGALRDDLAKKTPCVTTGRLSEMERAKRLELSTSTLARWCSTN